MRIHAIYVEIVLLYFTMLSVVMLNVCCCIVTYVLRRQASTIHSESITLSLLIVLRFQVPSQIITIITRWIVPHTLGVVYVPLLSKRPHMRNDLVPPATVQAVGNRWVCHHCLRFSASWVPSATRWQKVKVVDGGCMISCRCLIAIGHGNGKDLWQTLP